MASANYNNQYGGVGGDGNLVFRSEKDKAAWRKSPEGQAWIAANSPNYARTGEPGDFGDVVNQNDVGIAYDPDWAGKPGGSGGGGGGGSGGSSPSAQPYASPFGGRPISTGPQALNRALRQVIAPQYQQLRQEVLGDHPALELDETTQNILKAQGDSISSMLRGEIPADVEARVSQLAAEKALRGGLVGQSARNMQARDLGLTSMDIQEKGRAAASDYVAKEREWSTLKSDFLMKAREMDLKGQELRNASIQLDAQILADRIKTVGGIIGAYWDSVYKLSSLKNPDQATLDNLRRDYSTSMLPLAYQGERYNQSGGGGGGSGNESPYRSNRFGGNRSGSGGGGDTGVRGGPYSGNRFGRNRGNS